MQEDQSQKISLKSLVHYLVKLLIEEKNWDSIQIKEIDGSCTSIIELSVAKEDIGKVIGKTGKTIKAIRTLLMSIASKHGMRISLEVVEPVHTVPDHVV